MINGQGKRIWVDAEVHLLPPKCCEQGFRPAEGEEIIREKIYDHPEGPLALSQASSGKLIEEMDASGIEKAVVMGIPWMSPEMCWQNNEYIAEAAERHRGRLIGIGVLPPPAGRDVANDVRRVFDEYGLKGVKAIPSWQGYALDDESFNPALDEIERSCMVLVPHTDHVIAADGWHDSPQSLYRTLVRHPGLKVLAPHLGGLLCLYNLLGSACEVLKNVLFVTTVPATMQMVAYALDALGAERLAFGSDYPFNPSHDQRSVRIMLEELRLPEADLALISGANVLRFFGGEQ